MGLPWQGISSVPPHDGTTQKQEDNYALSGIRTHEPSINAGKTYVLDRATSVFVFHSVIKKTKEKAF